MMSRGESCCVLTDRTETERVRTDKGNETFFRGSREGHVMAEQFPRDRFQKETRMSRGGEPTNARHPFLRHKHVARKWDISFETVFKRLREC